MANADIELTVVDSVGDKIDPQLASSLKTTSWVAYGLFALGLFSGGLFSVIALILAHVQKSKAMGTIYESHFGNIIKTGWVLIIGGIIGAILVFVVVGGLILFLLWCWCVYRLIRGGLALNEGRVYG